MTTAAAAHVDCTQQTCDAIPAHTDFVFANLLAASAARSSTGLGILRDQLILLHDRAQADPGEGFHHV